MNINNITLLNISPETIAVWTAIGLSTISLGISILALTSQKRQERLQLDLSKKPLKPEFKVELDDYRLTPPNDPKEVVLNIILTNVSDSTALKTQLIPTNDKTNSWKIKPVHELKDRVPYGAILRFTITGPLDSTGKNKSIHMGYQNFEFSYSDKLKNRYTLIITYVMSQGKAALSIKTEFEV